MDNVSWTSSLLALFLMIGALAALPWVLRRWQQRQQGLHVLGQPATAQPAAASFAGVMAQVQDGTASTTTTAQP